jgi:hypothetical protein
MDIGIPSLTRRELELLSYDPGSSAIRAHRGAMRAGLGSKTLQGCVAT